MLNIAFVVQRGHYPALVAGLHSISHAFSQYNYVLCDTGSEGFGPSITDLEGRCLIQTRPRAHWQVIIYEI